MPGMLKLHKIICKHSNQRKILLIFITKKLADVLNIITVTVVISLTVKLLDSYSLDRPTVDS